jgi:DNA-directed RNA polymerase specialized sigma subunit
MKNVKEYLEQIFLLAELIEADRNELEDLQAFARSVMPIIGNNESLLVEFQLTEQEITQEIEFYIATCDAIKRTIAAISDNRDRLIFYKRYMERKPWWTIADEIKIDLSYVHRLHKKALPLIQIIRV